MLEQNFDKKSMLEIARISEDGSATIAFDNLTIEQKSSVQTLLGISGKTEGSIKFGIEDEATLIVISGTSGEINDCLVSVISPENEMGKKYLYN